MGKRRFLWSLVGMICASAILSACWDKDDYDFNKIAEVQWDPSYAVPLLHGELSIDDIIGDLENFTIESYPDGLLYFKFESQNSSDELGSLVELPDLNNFGAQFNMPFDISGNIPNDLVIIDETFGINLGINSADLDTIFYNSFNLIMNLNSTINSPLEIMIRFPTFRSDEGVLEWTFTDLPFSIDEERRNLLADLSTLPTPYNRFPVELRVTLLAGNVNVQTGDVVQFGLSMLEQDFKYVKGYVHPDSRLISDEDIEIDLFKNKLEGAEVSINGAIMNFLITNEFGIPIRIDFEKLFAKKENGDTLNILIDPPSPFDLNSPDVFGGSAETSITITNPAEVFDFEPTAFEYRVRAFANYNIPDGRNFLIDTSQTHVTFTAEIPLHGQASGITMKDTANVDLNQLEIDGIDVTADSAILKTRIINEYPIDAFVQVLLLDENFRVLDSLLTGEQKYLVRAAETNDTEVVNPGIFDDEIALGRSQLDNLFDAAYFLIIGQLRTFTAQDGTMPDVKFFEGSSLDVKMGLRTDLNVSVKP